MEGRYIVNKLAKVIKSKGSSSKSRNSQKKQNASVPASLHENLLYNNNNTANTSDMYNTVNNYLVNQT